MGTAPLFDEPYRPQFHYTPRRHWMNDPNGLVYHEGTYHLFYQHNPEGPTWGHMSWGHATSTDLVHWAHEGVAIPEEGNEMIFSGSAVVDAQNTTGFGDAATAPLVAVYTSHYAGAGDSFNQAQSLAYSTDGGTTWTKYDGNPVLDHPAPDFRDPNVFWYEPKQTWIMAVALPTQHKIQFYESTDLKRWTHRSDFGPAGSTDGIWECPALFQVPVERSDDTRWVLSVDVGTGAVAGGSGSQYFVGAFDGTAFTPTGEHRAQAPHWADYGPDFYAAIPWTNAPAPDDRPLWLAWMSNWNYAKRLPTSPWRGAQTVPRSMSLRPAEGGLQLVQRPVEALQSLRTNHVQLENQPLPNEPQSLADMGVSGTALELIATFAPGDATTMGLHVRAGETEKTVVGYDAVAQSVFVNRTNAGADAFHDAFAARNAAPLRPSNGRITLRVLVDRSSVEVFANGGERVLTHRIFPAPSSDGVSVFATDGTASLARLDAWSLHSIWSTR